MCFTIKNYSITYLHNPKALYRFLCGIFQKKTRYILIWIYWKKYFKNKLKLLMNHLNFINVDWEDASFILQAKNFMSSQTCRNHNHGFNLISKEFRAFLQWWDDRIIQYLVSKLDIENNPFFWRYDSRLKTALINNENINEPLLESNFGPDRGTTVP
jgi:hypothetical protein